MKSASVTVALSDNFLPQVSSLHMHFSKYALGRRGLQRDCILYAIENDASVPLSSYCLHDLLQTYCKLFKVYKEYQDMIWVGCTV